MSPKGRDSNRGRAALRQYLSGMADLFDLFGMGSIKANAAVSDDEAMRRDLEAVGQDLWFAIDKYRAAEICAMKESKPPAATTTTTCGPIAPA